MILEASSEEVSARLPQDWSNQWNAQELAEELDQGAVPAISKQPEDLRRNTGHPWRRQHKECTAYSLQIV